MTQHFGKRIDDHLFHVPQPSPEELRRLEATAVALRAAEDVARVKQRLAVSPELLGRGR